MNERSQNEGTGRNLTVTGTRCLACLTLNRLWREVAARERGASMMDQIVEALCR